MKATAAQAAEPATRPRTLAKEMFARIAERALERDGRKLTAIAEDMGTDAPNLSRWKHSDEPHSANALHLLLAAGTASHGVAVDIHRGIGDELGEQSIPRVDVRHGDDHATRLSVLTVECTDVPRTFAVAIADGALTDEEIESIRQQGRESLAAVLELDAYLAREQLRRRGAR